MPWRPCPPAAITRYWRPSVTRKVTGVALRFASRPQVEVVREHGMRDMPGEVIQAEKPAAAGAGRARREGPESYWLIRYVRSPLSDLKDSTVYPAFFIAPAMKPRTVCFCQPIFSIISAKVAPFFRWSMATTWAVLLPSRGPSVCGFVAFLGALAACLAVLGALAFSWSPWAWRAQHGVPVSQPWPSWGPSALGSRYLGRPAPPGWWLLRFRSFSWLLLLGGNHCVTT